MRKCRGRPAVERGGREHRQAFEARAALQRAQPGTEQRRGDAIAADDV
jgi:hypothetical protein